MPGGRNFCHVDVFTCWCTWLMLLYCRQESDRLKSIRTWERRPLDTINTLKQLGIGRTRGLSLQTIQPFFSLQLHSFLLFCLSPLLWCHLLGSFYLLRLYTHLSDSVHVISLSFLSPFCHPTSFFPTIASLAPPFVNPSIFLSVIPSFNDYLSSSVVLSLHLLSLFSSV